MRANKKELKAYKKLTDSGLQQLLYMRKRGYIKNSQKYHNRKEKHKEDFTNYENA